MTGNSASHGWGTAGSNGAQVEFTADGQTLDGDIIVDTISTLTMTMKNGSTFTGTINVVDNAEGGTAVSDNAIVTIESGCTWNLTGNCTLTSLTNNGTINFNGYTITLADGTALTISIKPVPTSSPAAAPTAPSPSKRAPPASRSYSAV